MEKEKNSNVQKPKRWLYWPGLFLLKIFCRIWYGFETEKSQAIKEHRGSLIIIGNHVSYMDPLFMATAFGYSRPINFLASNIIMNGAFIRYIFKKAGVIPTTQFMTSPGSTRAMVRLLQNGASVAFYPEAERSITGSRAYFGLGTARFLKFMKTPVAFCSLRGAFLHWPRWAPSQLYRGKVKASLDLILSKEDLEKMSPEAIHEKLCAAFPENDYDWQNRSAKPNSYRSKSTAVGLEKQLCKCPNCLSDFSLVTMKTEVFCQKCTCEFKLNQYGFFSETIETESHPITHPGEWYDWQKQALAQTFSDNPKASYRFKGFLSEQDQGTANEGVQLAHERKGVFVLTASSLDFYPSEEHEKMRFVLTDQSGIMIEHGLYAQFIVDRSIYRAYFGEISAAIMVRMAWELAKFN